MSKYELSELALADLEDIFAYTIETFGLVQAEKYKSVIEAGLKRVAADPRLGRAVEDSGGRYFQYNCESHGIFYTKQIGSIFVVRVLHLARDFKRHLPE